MKATRPQRALIVDDDPIALALVRAVLTTLGHEVIGAATDGEAAVQQVKSTRPDVVVMDVSMPRMDGLEASRRIQLECPVPIVLLTALDGAEEVQRAVDAGVGAYVVKPARVREVSRAVAIAVARFSDLARLRALNADLERALQQVRHLQGLLPICSGCKKIRDDKGYWHGVEEYIEKHTDATFTHGLCPACIRQYYPETIKEVPGTPA